MFRSILFIAVASVLGAVAFAAAQTGGHGSHAAGSATAAHRRMHAALEERNGVIAKGLGASLAFPADQNYYPGPLHVLEHKDALRLTAEQERRMGTLQASMFAASRPASSRLLEAEDRLRGLFAGGIADEPRVRAAVADVERAWTDVRLVHLLTHLQTRLVLTEEQRRIYHEVRWGS